MLGQETLVKFYKQLKTPQPNNHDKTYMEINLLVKKLIVAYPADLAFLRAKIKLNRYRLYMTQEDKIQSIETLKREVIRALKVYIDNSKDPL